MPKAIVVYDSRWGNTRQVAEVIAEAIEGVAGTETSLSHYKEVAPAQLADSDAIILGSPNHVGTATWGIRGFINRLSRPTLEGKLVAFFDTALPNEENKAVRKMEERARKKAPGLEVLSPGLSVRVNGMKGPIADGELARCREFGVTVATRMSGRAR